MDITQSISRARAEDKSAIKHLLESCQLPHEDLTENHLEHFFVIKRDSDLLGAVGLEVYQENGLIRSLAVTKESRGRGFGHILVQHIEGYAKKIGVEELVLLTTTAADYFGNRGYAEIERDEFPENVQESEEFTRLCPASAVAMRKSL